MHPNTVSSIVEALVATYTAGLEYYTKWQQRKWRENHYETRTRAETYAGGADALSTSLKLSSRKIKEAFDGGADILGDGFATGDETCRETLQDGLECLQERIYALYKATRVENGSLELFEAVRVSESVRISCLAALADQYRRVAVGRLLPRVLSRSQQRRPKLSLTICEEDTVEQANDDVDGEAPEDARIVRASSSKSPYSQSEPPSPPLTPKLISDDLQSTCTSATSGSGYGLRPKNSVFSMFCPEAMKYQVNPQKAMPKHQNCRCGYDWNGAHTENKESLIVNDGFQITPRFLGKSHCEGGFGCVLCTSSGRTEIYVDVADLRDHINASHTKWQMLHDRDMAGR
ncbi:hypothetical protein F4818DRAFT_216832 [Hypoxylon cercidicola]|nr:hypothetical protein F4818DRAFT_216832 [Hypoxylon cercidicola]